MADEETAESNSNSCQVGAGTPHLGRRRIYTRYVTVDESNVAQVVGETVPVHAGNAGEITFLREYWRGRQPILDRTKDVRPEICNKVVENRADEIMSFKLGYQSSEPIQYVLSRDGGDTSLSDGIKELNDCMFVEGKESLDAELLEWMFLCGVGYRMVEPDAEEIEHGYESDVLADTAPFTINVPDPRSCYVVYSKMYHHRPLAAVWCGRDEDDGWIYTVYTPKSRFTVRNGQVVESAPNVIGLIPIVEYDLNNIRVGVFEKVIPLLDAINLLDSNRLDGIEQVVQALYLFKNCQIDKDSFLEMLALGAVSVSSTEGTQGDVSLITNDLDQAQTQTVKEDLITAVHDICGMPTKNTGGANDTGSAVYMRDGYGMAEAHAKISELQFKRSEREFLRVALRICEIARKPLGVTLRDIDIAFNRRNYDNTLTKAQSLVTMLQTSKIDPLDCLKASGLFNDPEAVYARGMAYSEEQQAKALKIAQQSGGSPFGQFEEDGEYEEGEDGDSSDPKDGEPSEKPAE